ncbi:MAG: cache domain-containing protein, partial [Treponema sp.]|nr:cache domain-containing protein [Treponema sp.]
MRIGKKLIITIIALNLASTGILVGVILSLSKDSITGHVTNEITNLAGENADSMRAWMEVYIDGARTIAQIMEQYEQFDAAERRPLFNMLLKTMMEKNPTITGASTAWEPNALDNMDARFTNTEGTDGTGRFIPYWSQTRNGLTVVPLVGYETPGTGDYYLIPRRTGNETIVDPYWYPVDGQNVLITTMAVPIKNKGRFVGSV